MAMDERKVSTPPRRCVIIGAAPVEDGSCLPGISPEDFVICADGGLLHAKTMGITPDLVLGDFDSLENKALLSGLSTLQLPVEKDDTDTMAAIKLGLEKGYRSFWITGGMGGRSDHTFANYTALLYLVQHGAEGILTDGWEFVTVLGEGIYSYTGKVGWGLSVFPFGCAEAVFSESGVYYPLKEHTLTADFPLGVSNTVTEDPAVLQVHRGNILLFLRKN